MQKHILFVTCAKGMEELLADELRGMHIDELKITRAGIDVRATLAQAYRICLWSRLASRVLFKLADFPCTNADELYTGTQTIHWDQHLAPDCTFAVDFNGTSSNITHTHFAALKVKDAIVDQYRDKYQQRPSIDTVQPHIRINVYLHHDTINMYLDLSGDSLHRRGYRDAAVEAPLKENLASAILLRAQWPQVAANGGSLVDLMCGSGTFCIEAAMMAADIAPGMLREQFGFSHWPGHDKQIWEDLLTEAQTRREQGLTRLPIIEGYDADARAIQTAKNNAKHAGLTRHIQFTQRELRDTVPATCPVGLVIANPPYGIRLGEESDLPELYRELGNQFKQCFPNWRAAIFTGNPDLGKNVGLRPARKNTLFNGAIECRLFQYDVNESSYARNDSKPRAPKELSASAPMFANRLQKNIKHLGKWASRNNIYAYRLYDADMPEYNLAVDIYDCATRHVVVQEYEAPKTIEAQKAHQRLAEAIVMIQEVLQLPEEQIIFKQRRRQKSGGQYERLAEEGEFHPIKEGPATFYVNFTDYLDTGLFLDHRLTRQMIFDMARDKRFLNLFAYTGSVSVYAALGGARSTTTVDMSNTYLNWARRNFKLNNIKAWGHDFIQADVLEWIRENTQRKYDLIFIDPPTFSRSKRMQGTLDIQRDHVELLQNVSQLLAPDGVIVFSNNLRKFKLDYDGLTGFEIKDITDKTIPEDFKGNAKIHQCFLVTLRR